MVGAAWIAVGEKDLLWETGVTPADVGDGEEVGDQYVHAYGIDGLCCHNGTVDS